MRIVDQGAKVFRTKCIDEYVHETSDNFQEMKSGLAFLLSDTTDITDAELDDIVKAWNKKQLCTYHMRKDYCWHENLNYGKFSIYFNKLIKLKRLKQ
jgi:hypothetical protein